MILKYLKLDKLQTNNPIINYKIKATKNIIKILSDIPFKITSTQQLDNIKGIGKKTIDKINELLETGKISLLEILRVKYKNVIHTYLLYKQLSPLFNISKYKLLHLIDYYKIKSVKKFFQHPVIKNKYNVTISKEIFLKLNKKISHNTISTISKLLHTLLQTYNYSFVICGFKYKILGS